MFNLLLIIQFRAVASTKFRLLLTLARIKSFQPIKVEHLYGLRRKTGGSEDEKVNTA